MKNANGELGVLEIKCPEKIDVPWIVNGKLVKNHTYYTQIQLTMYTCNAKFADLFIYTADSHKIIDVPFDMEFC